MVCAGEMTAGLINSSVTPSCRDPKDNKFLEAALAGSADCIVTGGADLLVRTPFEGIPILSPAEFLARLL